MKEFIVSPSAVHSGTVNVPGDKSVSHRALMFAAIADGDSTIDGLLPGEDCLATLAALQRLGVPIELGDASRARVRGVGIDGLAAADGPLDLGNSGTAMRLFAGLLSGQSFDSELTGDASLSARPMGRVIGPLQEMGARIESRDGKPPLLIRGGRALRGIDYPLPVASAQVKSALLLAGLQATGRTCVVEPAVTRDHTERLLSAMGIALSTSHGRICLRGPQRLQPLDIKVPGDLSSAAFPLVACLLAQDCELTIPSVGVNPTRTGIIDILRDMGADIRIDNPRQAGAEPVADLRVRSSSLLAVDVGAERVSLAIDEFPVLFVAAAAASGTSRFSGLGELRVKESDRIGAMVSGLRSLGIDARELGSGVEITGGDLGSGSIDSHGDHRIAMSFAVAATRASGPVRIRDVQPVETSFPGFAGLMQSIGVDLSISDKS